MFKIGHSKDVHQLVNNRKLIIGGETLEFEKGLLGHSDADVLVHAVAESIIGALGLGDLGTLYPDNDQEFKDCNSMLFLDDLKVILKKQDYKICNIDATIFAEAPKMLVHTPKMKSNIANALGVDPSLVNVKATRGEKMGFIGRGEGIGAESVVLITRD